MLGVVADLVVILHLVWILFLIFGAVLGRRRVWIMRLHLLGLGFAVVLTAAGWICPLTHLEVWLRRQAGGAGSGYRGTFVGHLVERLVYVNVPRSWVLVVVILIVAVSIWCYRGAMRGGMGGEGERS